MSFNNGNRNVPCSPFLINSDSPEFRQRLATISQTDLDSILGSNYPSHRFEASPLHSPIASAASSPRIHSPPPQLPYQLREFSIPLTDIRDQLHLYQRRQRRGRPRGRAGSTRVAPRTSRGGRGRGRGRSRGRSRRTSSSGGASPRERRFDNELIHIERNEKKIPTKVCRHLMSHCTKKHPRTQDNQVYQPILIINDE